ncbi:MAG: sortase B protein-sorting domain-containing protein [Erysipelotrichaceae bacterium]|nr:sortase B protein-sorting domain-containing protein [Erysipelotrichaceae bacterium]
MPLYPDYHAQKKEDSARIFLYSTIFLSIIMRTLYQPAVHSPCLCQN